jgi:hypothetical protein
MTVGPRVETGMLKGIKARAEAANRNGEVR